MALNITQLRNLIEDITGLQIGNASSDDISQTLVDNYIREGFDRIVTLEDRWPYFQAAYSLSTVANQRAYTTGFTRTAPTNVPNITFADIREIISVTNQTDIGNQLGYIDDFKVETYFRGDQDLASIPQYFSIWADQLQLWPKPDDVYNLTIRGYRQPSYAWLTDTGQNVDLNDEFHIMLINFVASRTFAFQEDPQMSAVYMAHFEQGIVQAKNNLTSPNSNQPLILSGGFNQNLYSPYNYMANLAIRAVRTGEWS